MIEIARGNIPIDGNAHIVKNVFDCFRSQNLAYKQVGKKRIVISGQTERYGKVQRYPGIRGRIDKTNPGRVRSKSCISI